MYALVGAEYGQRYRPMVGSDNSSGGGPLAELKRLLSSRSKVNVCKATGFVTELIQRCPEGSTKREQIVNYLLDGDICVFLCDTMATLDWDVVRGTVHCLELLSGRRLVMGEHAAYLVSCAVRLCLHCVDGRIKSHGQVLLCCLSLVADIFIKVRQFQQNAVISSTSTYNIEQLLGLLSTLADHCSSPQTSLSSALLLHAVMSHQPEGLRVGVKCAEGLALAVEKWMVLLCSVMMDGRDDVFYGVVCHLGIDALRLCSCIRSCESSGNFVQKLMSNEDDILTLKQQTNRMAKSVYLSALEVVSYTKENWENISNSDYTLFLLFLKAFLTDSINTAILPSFSEMLATNGYLTLLPRNRLLRDSREVRALSISSLGELLSHLCRQYLGRDSVPLHPGQYTLYINNLQKELSDLPHDVTKWPQSLSARLCTVRPYSLLVYLYFNCLTSTSPQVISAPLLPFLVEHVLSLPQRSRPPDHIVKCLWLVFAMARISNGDDSTSMQERVRTERATRSLVQLISSRPQHFYTHHVAILLCSFVSDTIPPQAKIFTLTLWLERESNLPEELASEPIVIELLLKIMQTDNHRQVVLNAAVILKSSVVVQADRDIVEEVGVMVWRSLPDALTKILQNYDYKQGVNLQCLVELATEMPPEAADMELYHRLAHLTSVVFSRMFPQGGSGGEAEELSYYCLKLAYFILYGAKQENDDKALSIMVNGFGFVQTVLVAARSAHVNVSCMALQLLSYILYAVAGAGADCRCEKELQLEPAAVATILHQEMYTPKGPAFLQLLYAIMSSANVDRNIPVNLATGTEEGMSAALRVLLFRVQMICCKESREKSAVGWKTLNMMMKYIINYRRDNGTVIAFATQPWTFTLVRFQLSQRIDLELLIFLKSWLTCLKIIILDSNIENLQHSVCNSHQYSLFTRTLTLIRKSLARYDDTTECSQRPKIVGAILDTVSCFSAD